MNSPPTTLSAPAASLPAVLGAHFVRACRALWHGLEAHGQERASRELHAAADRCQFSDPERAQMLRDANRFIRRRQS